jgi:glycosyltransferase involved in cell wall biosynthesis
MTVLHFSSATSWRGGEQQIVYLLEELQDRSIKQIVLCVKGAPLADYCKRQAIAYFTYPKRGSIDLHPARLLNKLCKEHEVNLVHLHDSHAHTYACIAASIFKTKTPLVLSRRVDFPISSNPLSSWKYNHPAIKAIICVSHFIKSVIEPRIKNIKQIKVVHSGIDLSRFTHQKKDQLRQEYDISPAAPLIVNVAAIAPHKDYFTFVDTVKYILEKRPDARFLIIGADGGEADAVRQYVQRTELSEYIKFTGFRKDIPSVLPGADVFLFTSKEEGLGTSLLDALACKVPVVATRAGGIPEIIEHEISGLLGPVQQPQILAEQVVKLLEQQSLCEKLILGGLKKLQLFDKVNTAKRTYEIYESILY